MSVIEPVLTELHHFYRSVPMPCPYLPGRVERKLFARLSGPDPAALNALLSRAGFRRSHDIVYRPVCPACSACVPIRIVVGQFAAGRNLRRVAQANSDLTEAELPPLATVEQFRLFGRYQRGRHAGSDMARMSEGDYRAMIEEGAAGARLLEFRDGAGGLAGAILIDRVGDGLSAVYSFFDPDQNDRSLGTLMVLRLVERARAEGLPYVYLGYWVRGSRTMAYKARFRPLEQLGGGGWVPLDPS